MPTEKIEIDRGCCDARHMAAKAPWTCDCDCHRKPASEEKIESELPEVHAERCECCGKVGTQVDDRCLVVRCQIAAAIEEAERTKPENPPAPRDERREAHKLERVSESRFLLHSEVLKLVALIDSVCEQRDALLKPHNSDGTITCGSCGKTIGSDGIVESLMEVLKERDSLKEQLAGARIEIANRAHFEKAYVTEIQALKDAAAKAVDEEV